LMIRSKDIVDHRACSWAHRVKEAGWFGRAFFIEERRFRPHEIGDS